MATPTVPFTYLAGLNEILSGTLDLETTTLKMMLINSTYQGTYADATINASSANDAYHGEITATGYTRGYGNTGRKTVAAPTATNDNTNKLTKLVFANVVYGSLGGATNDTILGAILLIEGTSDDTTSIPICFLPLTVSGGSGGITTNGSTFTVVMDSVNGNVQYQLIGV